MFCCNRAIAWGTAATRRIPSALTVAEAQRSVVHYARSWIVHPLTTIVVLEAVQAVGRLQLSYWDSLIWATAKLNGIPTILSEDFSDSILLDEVRVLNPFLPSFDPLNL